MYQPCSVPNKQSLMDFCSVEIRKRMNKKLSEIDKITTIINCWSCTQISLSEWLSYYQANVLWHMLRPNTEHRVDLLYTFEQHFFVNGEEFWKVIEEMPCFTLSQFNDHSDLFCSLSQLIEERIRELQTAMSFFQNIVKNYELLDLQNEKVLQMIHHQSFNSEFNSIELFERDLAFRNRIANDKIVPPIQAVNQPIQSKKPLYSSQRNPQQASLRVNVRNEFPENSNYTFQQKRAGTPVAEIPDAHRYKNLETDVRAENQSTVRSANSTHFNRSKKTVHPTTSRCVVLKKNSFVHLEKTDCSGFGFAPLENQMFPPNDVQKSGRIVTTDLNEKSEFKIFQASEIVSENRLIELQATYLSNSAWGYAYPGIWSPFNTRADKSLLHPPTQTDLTEQTRAQAENNLDAYKKLDKHYQSKNTHCVESQTVHWSNTNVHHSFTPELRPIMECEAEVDKTENDAFFSFNDQHDDNVSRLHASFDEIPPDPSNLLKILHEEQPEEKKKESEHGTCEWKKVVRGRNGKSTFVKVQMDEPEKSNSEKSERVPIPNAKASKTGSSSKSSKQTKIKVESDEVHKERMKMEENKRVNDVPSTSAPQKTCKHVKSFSKLNLHKQQTKKAKKKQDEEDDLAFQEAAVFNELHKEKKRTFPFFWK